MCETDRSRRLFKRKLYQYMYSSGSSDSVAGVYFPYLKLWIRVDVSIYGGLSLKMVCRKQKKTRKHSTVNLL